MEWPPTMLGVLRRLPSPPRAFLAFLVVAASHSKSLLVPVSWTDGYAEVAMLYPEGHRPSAQEEQMKTQSLTYSRYNLLI